MRLLHINSIKVCAVGLVIATTSMSSGFAEEKTTASADTVATTTAAQSATKDKVKIFLDRIEILGRIDRPQTVFIIPGKDATINDIQLDRSFFREIFRSVEKDDFHKRRAKATQKKTRTK